MLGVDQAGELPAEFSLSVNPNPFNSSTTITYGLDKSAPTLLEIYDISGRLVETLVEGEMDAGQHELNWQVFGMTSGVYFVYLNAGINVQVKKAVVVR